MPAAERVSDRGVTNAADASGGADFYNQRVRDRITDIVTVGVVLFVGARLVSGLRYSVGAYGRRLTMQVVRGLGWRHVWPVPIVLTAVIAAASLLTQIPGLGWGWWTAFGGQGNPVFGTNSSTEGTIFEWLIPTIFIMLLLPVIPLFANAEERMFRAGAEQWSLPRRAYKVVLFGLVHTLIGVPIGTALALGIGGAYFMVVYLRTFRVARSTEQAVLESTRAHTAYNASIVMIVALALALTPLT